MISRPTLVSDSVVPTTAGGTTQWPLHDPHRHQSRTMRR
jgi:hypothetical protein